LWFLALLLSVSLFSSIYGRLYGLGSFIFVFRITMIFALPVACLCLPVVIAMRDRKEGTRIIVAAGSLIGPVCLVLWGVLREARGVQAAWSSDGIGFSIITVLILASIVGCLTTIFYIIALKLFRGLSASSK
jgi:hypothetical protein